MIMNLKNYNKTQQTDNLISSLKYNKDLLKKINILYNSNIDEVKISIEKVVLKKDEELRCKLQNSIFSSSTRVPLEVEDIENDIEQEYYIEDLSLFIKVNNIAIGYGQIIYNRDMYTVVNFGIIKDFRNYGFGKILLNQLIQTARNMNIDDLFIRVEETNYSALKLYNWIGFTPKSIINRWER